MRDRLARVDFGTEFVGSRKRDVDKPNTTTGLISLEIWVVCVKVSVRPGYPWHF